MAHLDRGEIRRAHEKVDQIPPSILVVEEDEQCPVQQPGALLELNQGHRKGLVIDGLLDLVDVVSRSLEVLQTTTD